MPRGHFLFFCLLLWGYSFCHEVILFPWVFFFLPWGFSFCREVFLFAVRFFFLPWGKLFCRDSWLGRRTFEILFTKIIDFFFNMWVFVRTRANFAHLVSFHYSSHRIRGLAHSENAGHFCMSDKWKQSFQNAVFCNCCSRRTRTRCQCNAV